MLPPTTVRQDLVELLEGHAVADPYRWLEDARSPEVKRWCAAQDRYAAEVLSALPDRAAWRAAIGPLLAVGEVTVPRWRGGLAFFTRREAGAQHAVLWVRTPDGTERVLVDPTAVTFLPEPDPRPSLPEPDPQTAPPGEITLEGWNPSPDGSRISVDLARGGDEESERWILDVSTGRPVEGPVTRCRRGSLAWWPDSAGYFYVRRLPPGRVPPEEQQYHHRVWRHTVGTDPDTDVEVPVGTGPERTSSFQLQVSADGRWLVAVHRVGAAPGTDVWIAELSPAGLAQRWVPVQLGIDAHTLAWIVGDRLYLLTDRDAPQRRLCVTDPADPGYPRWRELLPEQPEALLTDVVVVETGDIVAARLTGARSRLSWHGSQGEHRADLPVAGTVTGLAATPEGGRSVWIGHTDFATAGQVLHWSVDCPTQVATWARAPGTAPAGRGRAHLAVDDRWYPSADGTPVHAFVLRDSRADRSGPRPTILTGYGGFGVCLTPGYSPAALAWVNAGGVYVVAGVRGGGEQGRAWHSAGAGENKIRSFEDLEAVADGLVADGWCRPDLLGLDGSSNGGLLAAAALVRRPTHYGAGVCTAALLDMVRYERWGLGRLWSSEYGSAHRPVELAWLLAYSPYHHVRVGTAYPPALLVTFESDTRVDPLHSRKMCAAMQYATTGPGPVVLRREQTVGHGTRGVASWTGYLTDTLTFLAHHLGLAAPSGPIHQRTRQARQGSPMPTAPIRDILLDALRDVADVDPTTVTDEQSYADDLDVDSLSFAEVIAVLEDRLDIRLSEQDAAELTTVGTTIAHLERLCQARQTTPASA